MSGTHPERHVLRRALHRFYASAAAARAPEIHRLATTIETWWPAIEAAILTGHSNARSEGYNRLAKHEGRNAFGFRNPINQRRRIRWACTRQHRQGDNHHDRAARSSAMSRNGGLACRGRCAGL